MLALLVQLGGVQVEAHREVQAAEVKANVFMKALVKVKVYSGM